MTTKPKSRAEQEATDVVWHTVTAEEGEVVRAWGGAALPVYGLSQALVLFDDYERIKVKRRCVEET